MSSKEVKKPVATVKAGVVKAEAVAEKKEAAAKAPVKKETAKAPAAKKAAPAKKETVKPAEKKAEVKKEEKVMEKKTAAKKAPAAKKETAAKAPVKKEAAKAPVAKKAAAVKQNVVLQFNGNDYTQERLVQSAKDVWQYDFGRDVADIKELELYVKPEENKVYVVVNGSDQDSYSFDI